MFNKKILTVAFFVFFLPVLLHAGSVFVFNGIHHAAGGRKNQWNAAATWTNGPAAFPNAPGAVARSMGEIRGDVDLYLNEDISIGTLLWHGNQLFIHPGDPAGTLIVDNEGRPSRWNITTYYGFRLYCDVVLNNSIVISNWSRRDLQFRGSIAGPGGIRIIWHQDEAGDRNECLIGRKPDDPVNTYAGGTFLQAVNPGKKGRFRVGKNGAFGSGTVKLNANATLIIGDLGEQDDCIGDAAALILGVSGGQRSTIVLENNVCETVGTLTIAGEQMPPGTYGSPESNVEYVNECFDGPGTLVVAQGPVPPAKIANRTGASDVTTSTALLNGLLVSSQDTTAVVRICWGNRDGGKKAENWEHRIGIGRRNPGAFSAALSNLEPGQTYYYRCIAQNSRGTTWAGRTMMFKTQGPPEIETGAPVLARDATRFRGVMIDTNGAPAYVWIYYGREDGGTSPDAWDHTLACGTAGNGPLEVTVTNLPPHSRYSFRFYASNIFGATWAGETRSCVTAGTPAENNVTFFCISDVHFGYSDAVNAFNPTVVDMMNLRAGNEWPESLGGGFIEPPRAVVLPGDTTVSATELEWGLFTNYYGLIGESRLAYPVYEGWGNHDGGKKVIADIKKRNRHRPGLTRISKNGYHYSWDWGPVHCVQLNISAGGEWHPYNPHHSLTFLTNDLVLSVGSSGRPVLLFQHISIRRHGAIDITGEAKTNFYNAIQPYNIAGLFHGHRHDSGHYTWRGIDVFNTTHMHRETDEHPPRHGFLVVQITTNRMRVAEYKSDGTWGYTFSKSLELTNKNRESIE